MSSIRAWLYSSRSAAPNADSKETVGREDVTSSLANMSEQSRAAAAGKGVEQVASAAVERELGASEDANASEAAESSNSPEARNSTAQIVPEPDFLLDGGRFGTLLCVEMEQKENPAEVPPSVPPSALYPEVANWLVNTCTNQGVANTNLLNDFSDKKNAGKSRPSLIQRIDRYLFPPSKLIVDGTLIPFPTDERENAPSSSSKKRDRSLIGTAKLGSIVGRTAKKTPPPPPPQTLRSNQVLLWGATTVEAHYHQIRHTLETARGMHGADGLRACGFEYRLVPCDIHAADAAKSHKNKTSGESSGQHEGIIRDNNAQQNSVLMKSISSVDDADSNPDRIITRGRSLSDAGVSYGSLHGDESSAPLPNLAPTSHSHHQMIIVPSYAPNVGDLVESAAIREKKVRGFADTDAHSRIASVSSETSLSTIFDNMLLESDDDADSIIERSLDATNSGEEISRLNEVEAKEELPSDEKHCSFGCFTRLFHIFSDTMITEENWNRYIAFGDMYDEICRMCQEFAQEQMIDEGGLIWVTICEDSGKGNPIRALVDEDHSQRPGPILLVITGKGNHLKGGIFSRRHMLTSGIECSTALPMVREAKRRGMKIAMIDPNARGEREGMSTFEMSVRALFGHTDWTKEGAEDQQGPFTSEFFNPYKHDCPLYVLAHSAAGGQLCRYLLDQAHHLLPQIAAIVFTDSTHNIQWAKRHESLLRLLESPACVYLRSSNVRSDDDLELKQAGDAVDVDNHWRRRFGNIETLWAGTTEHSLMNWTSHEVVWKHFDRLRIPDISQGVTKLQAAIDESLENGHGEMDKNDSVEDHHSVSTFDSDGGLPHKSKRDRSVDLVTL